MASHYTTQFVNHLEKELVLLTGYVKTDSNGAVTNASTDTDQDGDVLNQPKGFSVAQAAENTCYYDVSLDQPYFKLLTVDAFPYMPQGQVQAEITGSVDLTGLTLSTLNTLTLIIDDDVAAAFTVTFTTPSSVDDIVTQIRARQTAVGNTSTYADIETTASGARHLRIRSKTVGTASDMLITGTGRATLGMGDGSTHATVGANGVIGDFACVGFNPRGQNVNDLGSSAIKQMVQPAQSVRLIYKKADGTAGTLASGGFWVNLLCKNTNLA